MHWNEIPPTQGTSVQTAKCGNSRCPGQRRERAGCCINERHRELIIDVRRDKKMTTSRKNRICGTKHALVRGLFFSLLHLFCVSLLKIGMEYQKPHWLFTVSLFQSEKFTSDKLQELSWTVTLQPRPPPPPPRLLPAAARDGRFIVLYGA